MTNTIRVIARAKINLYLHVVGKRADGFHLLDSLIAFAGTGDVLEVRPETGFRLDVTGPTAAALPPSEINIVEKAARALAEAAGIAPQGHVVLTKTLPVAAGIGGGSADAAAALLALSTLWSVRLPPARLATLALTLGADVPMCLNGFAAQASGVGEVLTPSVALPPCWLVLVNPMVPCPTPAVFKARTGPFTPADPLTRVPKDAAALAQDLAQRGNDLMAPAIATVPVIGQVLTDLAAQADCLLARMSGSGATCFGLFATQAQAEAAAGKLTAASPGWWITAAPLQSQP